ncbi:MAG: hypothetical protein NZ822_00965 [Patescibacteria group bacterium]|nr:hypothetical protein [Patescibacteria group bacterium]
MNWQEKIYSKEKLNLLIIILLLNLFSFSLGFIIGAKIFIPNPIIINGSSCSGN